VTGSRPIGIPVDLCMCGHWREDHEPKCIVIEDNIGCICRCFTPTDEDDWGYYFTDNEGDNMEGQA
jgi:hypothetical protein